MQKSDEILTTKGHFFQKIITIYSLKRTIKLVVTILESQMRMKLRKMLAVYWKPREKPQLAHGIKTPRRWTI